MSVIRARLILMAAFACAVLAAVPYPLKAANAAEATLLIKVRLVRCVSQSERKLMCDSENLCCNFVDPAINASQAGEMRIAGITPYGTNPGNDAVWITSPAPESEQEASVKH